MQFSSALLEQAVAELGKLPGIGKKTALRLVLHLLNQDKSSVEQLSHSLTKMRNEIMFCKQCNNISDSEKCSICNSSFRKQNLICVVENIRDVIAIESTQQYNGTYHVLNGVISPLDGVGPEQLFIEGLIIRLQNAEPDTEIIFALSPTIQGDTTMYYINKQIQKFNLKTTSISRGIAFGGELEYADEMTLAKSLQNRVPIDQVQI